MSNATTEELFNAGTNDIMMASGMTTGRKLRLPLFQWVTLSDHPNGELCAQFFFKLIDPQL